MIDLRQYYKPVSGLIWSLFPFVMFICFIVMPSGKKKDRTAREKALTAIVGIVIVVFIGWELYTYYQTHPGEFSGK